MREALIIIHGWTKEGSNSFIKIAELLKDDFDIYLIDLPGFKKQIEKPYDFNDYLKYLESEIKIEKFYLLGHSFGGALAMLYTLKYPEKIKKLILYNPAIFREKNIKIKISFFLSKIFKFLIKIFPEKIIHFLKKAYYKFIIKSYDYFLADEKMKITFKNINQDLREKAKEIKVKTVILWGEKDKITPFKNAWLLKKLIQNSILITLPGGHSFHKEKPEEFAKILKEAIKNKGI